MAGQPHVEQSAETREKILATAVRLFSEQGYDHTSLSQVARDARVSKALILWHFETKDLLYRATLQRTLEPYFINIMDELEGLDEKAQIERLIDRFYEFVRDNVYSIRFIFSVVLRGEREPDDVVGRIGDLYHVFRTLLADVIESGRRSGCFVPNVHPTLDASLILAALDGMLVEQFMNSESDLDPSELIAHLKRTMLARLVA